MSVRTPANIKPLVSAAIVLGLVAGPGAARQATTNVPSAKPPARVVYLPQLHYAPPPGPRVPLSDSALAEPKLRKIRDVQVFIGNYLQKNWQPGDAVILEGMQADASDLSNAPQVVGVLQQAFKGGLPPTSAALTSVQTNLLLSPGAAVALYAIGKISALSSPAVEAAFVRRTDAAIEARIKEVGYRLDDPVLQKLLIDDRERELNRRVAALAEQGAAGRTIFIVFGSCHRLAPYYSDSLKWRFQQVDTGAAMSSCLPTPPVTPQATTRSSIGFCTERIEGLLANPRVGPIRMFFPTVELTPPITLVTNQVVACDSAAARTAKSAHIVPFLRTTLGEAVIDVDAFGPSYWKGDWKAFVDDRLKVREAAALKDGAAWHRRSPQWLPGSEGRSPLVWVPESTMYISHGAAAVRHYAVYYTISGDYAIEIRLSAPTPGLIMGTGPIVERAVVCPTCTLPKEAQVPVNTSGSTGRVPRPEPTSVPAPANPAPPKPTSMPAPPVQPPVPATTPQPAGAPATSRASSGSMPVASSRPEPVAATAEWFAGTWTGFAEQSTSAGPRVFRLTITAKRDGGMLIAELSYPFLGCALRWNDLSTSGTRIIMRQQVQRGNCLNGWVAIERLADDRAAFRVEPSKEQLETANKLAFRGTVTRTR